jgi:hypothetical protein
MEDQDYIRRRNNLLEWIRCQNVIWDKDVEVSTKNHAKRGRKPTKPSKYIETKPNTKMYATKSKFG